MPELISRVLEDLETIAELGRRFALSSTVLFLGPPCRLPGGFGGRAQAQGTGLHARRGLRGGRAQARPDRADRGRPTGHRGDAVAEELHDAARQAAVEHPRDSGPRRADHRDRRGGRRHGPALRRSPDRNPRRCQRFSSRCCRRSRCRYSRRRSRRPAATTSTSHATWPSPSPSNNPQCHIPHGEPNQDRLSRCMR